MYQQNHRWKRSNERPAYFNQPAFNYSQQQHHHHQQPHQQQQQIQHPYYVSQSIHHHSYPPPIVVPSHEVSPADCFHSYQQFQNILYAVELHKINTYNQMREYCQVRDPLLNVAEVEIPNTVDFVLHIHGNEFRHLITKLLYFGTTILQRMPVIHSKTGCKISLSDRFVGNEAEFNQIKFSSKIETVNSALNEFLTLLPLHVGTHLANLKSDLRSIDLRTKLGEWMQEGVYTFTDISFHFVKDSKSGDKPLYKYVVLRASRDNPQYLIDAAYEFGKLVLNNSPTSEDFSAGYRFPSADRLWFIGGPDGALVHLICELSKTTIKYSNVNARMPGNMMDFNVFGKPDALIYADTLLRKVSQVTLKFDVDDEELKEPHRCHPKTVNNLIVDNLVLITYSDSKYQMPMATGSERIRHSIMLKTSYENRHMLYKTRRELLKPQLIENLPLNEIEANPEELMFGEQLHRILLKIAHAPSHCA